MALMTRFLQLETTPDDKCLFTFLVTKAVTRDGSKDVVSKEFWCGFHKWAIGFSNHDKHLGVYLVWRSSSEGVSVRLGEAPFPLVNRDHVSQNITWSMAKGFTEVGIQLPFRGYVEGVTKVIHGSERGLWYSQDSECPKNQKF